jgi:hypothetical protein
MLSVSAWLQAVSAWARVNQSTLAWSAGLSGVVFVGSLLVMPVLLARIPADYFIRARPTSEGWFGRHPAARVLTRVFKNLVGVVLLVAGLAMMVLPGQGVITLLVALSLLEFPGKRRLELRLIRQPQVAGVIAWIRSRAGKPPLLLSPSVNHREDG